VAPKALGNDLIETGPLVEKFEDRISEVAGSPQRAVLVTNGTAALPTDCGVIQIQPGSQEVTSPLSSLVTGSIASVRGAKVDPQQDAGKYQ
jgi:dTDP-4-amino-4,6-dideoxygalactose transaminase